MVSNSPLKIIDLSEEEEAIVAGILERSVDERNSNEPEPLVNNETTPTNKDNLCSSQSEDMTKPHAVNEKVDTRYKCTHCAINHYNILVGVCFR